MKINKRNYQEQTHFRSFQIEGKRADDEKKIIPATLSTETPVARWFGNEILLHDATNVILDRASGNGLAMLFSHRVDEPIGKIRNVRIENNELKGDLHFANSTKAMETYESVRDGFLDSMSIGYRVKKWEEHDDDDEIRVTSWELLEASVVAVPADVNANIGRSTQLEEDNMSEKTGEKPNGTGEPKAPVVVDIARKQGIESGVAQERQRVAEIDEIFIGERFQTVEMQAIREDAIRTGKSVEDTRKAVLAYLGSGVAPVAEPPTREAPTPSNPYNPRVEHVDSGATRFAEDVTDAVLARGNCFFKEDGTVDRDKCQQVRKQNQFTSMPLMEVVRSFASQHNIDTRGPSERWVSHAMSYRSGGMANADLAAVIENIIGKVMMTPLPAEFETWRPLVKIGSLTDFKQTSRINLGSASNLEEVGNGSPIKRGYISDFKEYLKARSFGREIVVEYQTLRNDDIGVLTDLPLELRRKASRNVGDLVFGILTENPTLGADSTALFHSNHNNLVTAGGQPSVATLEAGYAAMATQKMPSPTGDDTNDPGDATNTQARFLVCGHALRGRSLTLMQSQYDPDANAGSQVANTVQNRFQVIADARIDTFNSSGWFLLADPMEAPTIEAAFVDGQEVPSVMQESDWHSRGIKYAVWQDVDVKPMDYRGMYYNDGVT